MRRPWTVLLIAAVLFLPGCGGDDDDAGSEGRPTATTTEAPDAGGIAREQYIARADRYCKSANKRAKAINERAAGTIRDIRSGKKPLRSLAPLLAEGYAFQRESVDTFKAIEPPPADRAIVVQLHALADQQTASVARLRDAAAAGSFARFRMVAAEQARLKLRGSEMARAYGFEECGTRKNEADG